MVTFTYIHDANLVFHPALQRLGVTLPTKFDYPIRAQHTDTASALARNCVRDYAAIIQKLADHITKLERDIFRHEAKITELDFEHRKVTAEKSALEGKHNILIGEKEIVDTRLQLLVSNFGRLVDGGDMEFIVGETSIPSHAAIVSVWSVPFATMLQSSMREGLTRKIEIKNEEPQPVRDMIQYFYTAAVELTQENALPLLRLSLLYGIESLRDLSLNFVIENISINNCMELFCLAHLHNFSEESLWGELLEAGTSFIKAHGDEILQSPELSGIGISLLAKIWPLIFDQNKESSELALAAFLNWTKTNWEVCNLPACIIYIDQKKEELGANEEMPVVIESSEEIDNKTEPVSISNENVEGKEEVESSKQNVIATGDSSKSEEIKNMDYFYKFCSEAIISDFENQSKIAEFQQLSSSYLCDLLQRDDLNVSNEEVVLEIVHSWARSSWQSRNSQLAELLECTRFPFLSFSYLLNIPNTLPDIAACPVFSSLMQEALQFQFKLGGQGQEEKEGRRTNKRRNYSIPQFNADEFASVVTSTVLKLPSRAFSLATTLSSLSSPAPSLSLASLSPPVSPIRAPFSPTAIPISPLQSEDNGVDG